MTHPELIDALGGYRNVARFLGLTENTPAHWLSRGIPAVYWLPVSKMARAKGVKITLEEIILAAPKPRTKRRRTVTAKEKPHGIPQTQRHADERRAPEKDGPRAQRADKQAKAGRQPPA